MTALADQSAAGLLNLLEFQWGGNTARYAAGNRTVNWGGHTWDAEPQAKVEFAKQTGASADEPLKITMRSRAPLDIASTEQPVPRITVTVREMLIGDRFGGSEVTQVYSGIVSRVRANRDGRVGLVSVDVAGWRSRLTIPLGILAGNTCAHAFGDVLCRFDVSSVRQTGDVSSILGIRVVVSGVSFSDGFALRGYVEYDGLRLMIRSQVAADTFDLVQPPPAAWAGATVTVTPGCDKSIDTCVGRWSNGINFGGYGIAIPAYNPLYEAVN